MKKKFWVVLLFITTAFFQNYLYSNSMDKLKSNKLKYITEFTTSYNNSIKKDANFDELLKCVKLSSILVEILDSKKTRMIIGLKGFKIATKMRKEYPEKVEGWYYSALLLGLVSLYKGAQFVLYDIPNIEKWTLKAFSINPGFKKGAPANLACAIYYEAPGFPVSIWDIHKAKRYCEYVRTHYPTNCTNYLYLAAIYDITQGKESAKQILLDGKKNCKAPDSSLEEKVWLEKDLESISIMLNALDNGKSIKNFMKNR